MEKKHELPEFQVILQNQANAKFFVASGGPFTPMVPAPTQAGLKRNVIESAHYEEEDSVW